MKSDGYDGRYTGLYEDLLFDRQRSHKAETRFDGKVSFSILYSLRMRARLSSLEVEGWKVERPGLFETRLICVTHSPTMRAFVRRYLLGYDPGEPVYGESVDLDFIDDRSLAIHYRNTYKEVTL